jgi:hypothetical protein
MKSSNIFCVTADVRTLFATLVLIALLALSSSTTFAQSVSGTNLGGGNVRITASTDAGVPYLWKICYKLGRFNPIPASCCLNSENRDIITTANPLTTTISGLKKGRWYTFAVKVQYIKKGGNNTKWWKHVGHVQINVN